MTTLSAPLSQVGESVREIAAERLRSTLDLRHTQTVGRPVGAGFEPDARACPGVRAMHSTFRASFRPRGPWVGSRSPQNEAPGDGQNGCAKR